MKQELRERTKQFALLVIRLCKALPRGRTSSVVGGAIAALRHIGGS